MWANNFHRYQNADICRAISVPDLGNIPDASYHHHQFVSLGRELDLPMDFWEFLPNARIQVLALTGDDRARMGIFPAYGEKVNLRRSAAGSLSCGIRDTRIRVLLFLSLVYHRLYWEI